MADGHVPDPHDRVLADDLARCELERTADRHDLGDAGERLDGVRRGSRGAPEGANRGALRARERHRRAAEFLDALDDRVDLLLRRVALHDHEH